MPVVYGNIDFYKNHAYKKIHYLREMPIFCG